MTTEVVLCESSSKSQFDTDLIACLNLGYVPSNLQVTAAYDALAAGIVYRYAMNFHRNKELVLNYSSELCIAADKSEFELLSTSEYASGKTPSNFVATSCYNVTTGLVENKYFINFIKNLS